MKSQVKSPSVYAGLGAVATMLMTPSAAFAATSAATPSILGIFPCLASAFVGAAIAGGSVWWSNKTKICELEMRSQFLESVVNERESSSNINERENSLNTNKVDDSSNINESENTSSTMQNTANEDAPKARHFAKQQSHLSSDKSISSRIPSIEDEVETIKQPEGLHAADPTSINLEDIANDYVANSTFKEHMIALSKGVAQVLADRLGSDNLMDSSLPIIERGTNAVTVQNKHDIPALSSQMRAERSISIAKRVPMVDAQEVFPDNGDRLSLNLDGWTAALEALDSAVSNTLGMDKRKLNVGAKPTPVNFVDLIGDADTFDEVDGLEADTVVLKFKNKTADKSSLAMKSYIDNLVDSEFRDNASCASRRNLRLIDCTGSLRKQVI